MKDKYYRLLKEWCDRLIGLQVTQIRQKEIYGGIICPACARIHGRSGDAIYPMMYLADETGEEQYLECAKRLFDWSERMVRPENCCNNDTNDAWNGITEFFQIQLGEALLYHGHLLDEATAERWMERFRLSSEYLYEHEIGGNINYPISRSACMAVAYRVLQDEKYKVLAGEQARSSLHYLTEEGLIYGEGHPFEAVTEKGCRPVDVGYNVEESLPNLVLYALLMEDEEVLEQVERSMEAHLEFMLPDGAWDNSWGSRNNKWSYWGSRTSDGCQGAYGILGDRSPVFALAADRNLELLRCCTSQGLLYGGPMFTTAGEPPCVHHTFCHAKALAAALEHWKNWEAPQKRGAVLPREKENGIRYYPSVHVRLLSKAGWRATVSDYDYEYSPEGHGTGGALTMLWNEAAGPVMAASMGEYRLIEPNNMQLPAHFEDICSTLRLEYQENGVRFRNINDLSANVECAEASGPEVGLRVTASGRMRDAQQRPGAAFEMEYLIGENVEIRGKCSGEHVRCYLPVIARSTDRAEGDLVLRIYREGAVIELQSSEKLRFNNRFPRKRELGAVSPEEKIHRMFNPVGGFEYVPLYIEVAPQQEFWVRIKVVAG